MKAIKIVEGEEPWECSDQIDNDRDGDVDCADSECQCDQLETLVVNNLLRTNSEWKNLHIYPW